jgi:hypothetical protein
VGDYCSNSQKKLVYCSKWSKKIIAPEFLELVVQSMVMQNQDVFGLRSKG